MTVTRGGATTWEIAGRGEQIEVPPGEDVGAIWRWYLRTATDQAFVDIRITRNAQQEFDDDVLPPGRAWEAIRAAGRPEVERLLELSKPPRYVHVSTRGCTTSESRSPTDQE
ncbi:hypothetical protein [Miltoncostaea oceani]|uniref:hypothetical protein n=1 Tax=Miltoncostaea oceani TaxID=2843216 RepID=UPI001C3D76F9|nr:hypothetical protein [Miltoncostaea oceani]